MTSIMNKNIQLPWIEKYRPGDTEQILLDEMLLEKIDKIIESKSVFAVGPYMISAPVFSANVTCPETKSAWK